MREDALAADTTPSVTTPAPLPPRRLHRVTSHHCHHFITTCPDFTTLTTPSPPLRCHRACPDITTCPDFTTPSPPLHRCHRARHHHFTGVTARVTTCPDFTTPSPPLHRCHRARHHLSRFHHSVTRPLHRRHHLSRNHHSRHHTTSPPSSLVRKSHAQHHSLLIFISKSPPLIYFVSHVIYKLFTGFFVIEMNCTYFSQICFLNF